MNNSLKKHLGNMMLIVLVPVIIWAGIVFLDDRKYVFISLITALVACVSFHISFENSHVSTRMLVLLAVMTGLCVIGRFLFFAIPGFKPVTAIVVLTGMYFGSQAGFMTGSMAALTSNLLFGQGPWTPFQMFAWGIIGFLAGTAHMQKALQKKIPLLLFGLISGCLYSVIMDVWSVIAVDGMFQMFRFQMKLLSSVPFMILYAVSNVFFLFLTRKSIGDKLKRLKMKYEI